MNGNEKYMQQYNEVSKEEYDTFVNNYKKEHKIKSDFFLDWYDLYDFKISDTTPIARNFFDKYYILKEVLKNENH